MKDLRERTSSALVAVEPVSLLLLCLIFLSCSKRFLMRICSRQHRFGKVVSKKALLLLLFILHARPHLVFSFVRFTLVLAQQRPWASFCGSVPRSSARAIRSAAFFLSLSPTCCKGQPRLTDPGFDLHYSVPLSGASTRAQRISGSHWSRRRRCEASTSQLHQTNWSTDSNLPVGNFRSPSREPKTMEQRETERRAREQEIEKEAAAFHPSGRGGAGARTPAATFLVQEGVLTFFAGNMTRRQPDFEPNLEEYPDEAERGRER